MARGAAGGATQPAEGVPLNRPLIVVCVMAATIMQVLDTTIANIALPYMQGSLGTTQDQINWVLTTYIVAAAIMTPPSGWLAARFGRRRLFLVSIAGFTLASVLCGGATSIEQIVGFRILQGVFGAALVPLSQAVMLDIYPPEQQGSAMAIWGMGVMVGPILGPTLGGWLTEIYNWRWVFFVNVPFGVLAFVGVLSVLPERRDPGRGRFDWFGFAMLSVALGAFQAMLDRGEQLNWFGSREIVLEAAAAALGLYLFVVHTLTAKRPFVDPALFRDRNLVTGLIFMFAVGFVLLATMALITPYLQNLMGYPVLSAGLALSPRGFGTIVAMMIVGRLIGKIDSRLIIFVGMTLAAIALLLMSRFTTDVSSWTICWTGVLQGFGVGFVTVPLTTLCFATLDQRYRADAAAFISLMRNLGSSVGVSVSIFLLTRNAARDHAALSEHASPFNPNLWTGLAGRLWNLTTPSGLAALDAEVTRQAYTLAYSTDFRIMLAVTLAAMPLLLLLRSPLRRRRGSNRPGDAPGLEHAIVEA